MKKPAGKRLADLVPAPKQKTTTPATRNAPETSGGGRITLAVRCMADIHARAVEWTVQGYIPLGKLVMVAGDGGGGKSLVTIHMAAQLSLGLPCFGLDYKPLPPSEVLFVTCEDDPEDTEVPRLLAAGADRSKIYRTEGIRDEKGKLTPFSLNHYEQVEAFLEDHPMVRLIVIDPAGAFIGRSGVDDHKDSELRSLLGPLSELAGRRAVTILLVKHMNRNVGAKAVHRVGGSAGYVNAVRSAFVAIPDPADESGDRRLLLPIKSNLPGKAKGLAYGFHSLTPAEQQPILELQDHLTWPQRHDLGEQLVRLDWLGEVEVNADEAMGQASKQGRGPNKVAQCAAWMETFLRDHAYPSSEVLDVAKKSGFTFDNVKEARVLLKAKGLRVSNQFPDGIHWWTGFGEPRDWKLRPESDEKPGDFGPFGEGPGSP